MENLFQYKPIMGVTINTVWISPAFREALVWVLAAAFAGALTVLLVRGRKPLQAVRLAAVMAFFAGGLVYALQADIGWGAWVRADSRAFSGKTTDEKLRTLEGPFYDFVLRSREVLQGDFALLNDSSDNYFTKRYQYFMLPLRKRNDAPAIVVLGDGDVRYDPKQGTFTRRDLVLKEVRPLMVFMRDAYIVVRPTADAKVGQ